MPRKLPKPRKRAYGHGSVSIQAGRYVATFKSLDTGRPMRQSFATDDEAQQHLDEWYMKKRAKQREQRGGQMMPPLASVVPPTMPGTFGELITGWRAYKTGTVRDTTWRNYGPALRALDHYLGDRPVDSLTEEHFVRYRRARLAGLDWKTRAEVKPLAAGTINAHLDRANDVFEWAMGSKPPLASHNPLARLVARGKKLKVEKFEPVVVDAETIERLIGAAAPAYRLEFALMGHLALRWGEALGVGIGHIRDGRVLIRQQVIENREVKPARIEISTYGGKTDYATRDLYASELILDAAREAYERLEGPNPHRLLRPTSTGTPHRENNWLRNAWKPALRRAGLEGSGLTPHGLRHSRLSLMAKSGKVTPGDLRRFAGHHSVAFTLAKYGDHFSSAGISPDIYLAA